MNKLFLALIYCLPIGLFSIPANAEALSIKFEPSLIFRQFAGRVEERPIRVVEQREEIHHYHDPYTHQDYYYHYPVRREYIQHPRAYPRTHLHSTEVQLGFRFK